MPKRQPALENVTDPVTTSEPKKKKKAAEMSPAVPKTPAATHKRVAPKTTKSKPASDRTVLARGEAIAAQSAPVAATFPTHQQIAERAYFYFLARGGQHGSDLDDWCRAERELLELA